MRNLGTLKTSVIVAFLVAGFYLAHLGIQNNKENKRIKKESYEKTKQKDYNKTYDSIHPIISTIPTRYRNLDSVKFRVQYIDGCKFYAKINGGSSDIIVHTISNCPKCSKLLLHL
tara:strand:+ start:719 stop:1063 length:345 start_codon:yes stop_codon:yes gene_type:complete